MKKTTIASIAVLALGAGTLSACSGGQGGASDYVVVNGSAPQNPLVPANTNETGGGRLVEMLFSGLVYFDADGESHNDVAESIETDDNQTYTVTLKEGEQFADGQPVTSNSFVDAWNFAMEQSLISASFFEPIEGFEEGAESMSGLKVQDDRTFTITLDQPEADFPLRLGYAAFYPMPEEAFDDIEAFGQNPNGNGPYKLENWSHGAEATLVPNENYDGDRKAQNNGLRFVFYAQQDAAYADLLSGNLDVLDSVPDSAFSSFEDELGDRSVSQPSAVFQSFTVGESVPHFGGEEGRLRREALSLAINRQEITDTIFLGTRTPATDFTSPVIPGHSDNLSGADVLQYNPDRARDLWRQADAISPFSGQFSIAYNSDGGHQAWVDAVANSLRNTLDIDAVGNPYPDFRSLRDDVTNRTIAGAFRTGWQADYPSLGNYLEPLYVTNGSSNDGDYSNPEFDALVERAAGSASIDDAKEHFNRAQEILLRDLPAIPLWYSNVSGGYSENVDHVSFAWNSQPVYYAITKNA